MRRALQLDPLSFLVNRRLGVALYYDRQYDAAIAQLQRAAEMEPSSGSVEHYLSLIYEQKGEHDEAVEHNLLALHEDFSPSSTATLFFTNTGCTDGSLTGARAPALSQTTSGLPLRRL